MSQVRANLRKQWQSLLIAMGIVIGIVVGCGGGGGGGGAQSASSGSGSTASQPSNSAVSSTVSGGNNIILSVQRAARAARKLPSNTVRVRATIVGTNISAVADFGPDVLAVTLELFAPLGRRRSASMRSTPTGTWWRAVNCRSLWAPDPPLRSPFRSTRWSPRHRRPRHPPVLLRPHPHPPRRPRPHLRHCGSAFSPPRRCWRRCLSA